ncbi:putative F-box/kelch-repeat protein At2g29800 isoform X1 [Capsella rubella]|uniref:putative F-box/kelch-repeat protein At2g29800 isoform X1 n=1 Tax=Capsella rubella TaxID=81985 RepID=UPI000CD55F5A|nr:putative F-box/kelch-repeat protein At2g29800 isoform X1 [Capsella rubella]
MAMVTEIPGDSAGGDPNKKPEEPNKNPQEEENQNKKLNQEEDQEEEEEVENLARDIPLINRDHIPEELCEIIVARVPRCHYPRLSLLSKAFRDVISSEQLFVTRSDLGVTEPVLYTLISSPPFDPPSWYILHGNNISLSLSRVTSIPPMFPGCTAVTIGHKIYVIGGFDVSYNRPVRTMFVIDCRFNTCRQLRSMNKDRCYAAAGVIDGKIYVVGGSEKRYYDWVEVFDVENETWEVVSGPFPPVASWRGMYIAHVVMEDKIYILDGPFCLAYDPRLGRWENWGLESPKRQCWGPSSCMVDGLLYAFNPQPFPEPPILVYDPKDMDWRSVKGITLWPRLVYTDSRMANVGGKLVILGRCQPYHHLKTDVWCVEVALEKREDGDILGKVEIKSISLVHSFREFPCIELSRTVTV